MYHSVTFGTKNTWDDWRLIPAILPVFAPPPLKTNYIELPNTDGEIDLLTMLVGFPTFGNRTGSFEFIVDNDFERWNMLYSTIANYLHGQVMQAVLEDDPLFYYMGRFAVNEWKSDRNFSMITIDYSVAPDKQLIGV